MIGKLLILILSMIFAAAAIARESTRLPAEFVEKRFSMNFKDTELKNVLRMIGEQGGLTVQFDQGVSGKISHSFINSTLEGALDELVDLNGLSYYTDKGIIYFQKDGGAVEASSNGIAKVRMIQISNAVAQSVIDKIPKNFMKAGESLIVDESTNIVVFHGSESSHKKLTEFIKIFDTAPIQIAIEAQIIETSKNFIRDIGFKWGLGAVKADTGGPTGASLTAQLLMGTLNDHTLDANLSAAESRGDAKIISRPKVVTLNNQVATINSGVTFNVKTLSQVGGTGTGGGSTPTITGGLQQVKAGLQLNVQPIAIGTEFVRLKISVTNSEPNDGLAVDGIPGIVDNSANTSIVVRDGNTAVMAGLIKSNLSKAQTIVPWLSKIPVLGWLFSSHSDKDRLTELVILITPRIILLPADLPLGENPATAGETTNPVLKKTN